MRGPNQYLEGLIRLHDIASPEERRAIWRQSMATLGEAILTRSVVPLEGLDPEALERSTRAVLASDLVEDLSFLSPAAAACALYGLASALPQGPEKRELGRRVLVRLHQSDAATFVALATSLALGSTKAFEGAGVRARVGLSLVLPISVGSRPDALALALISRRELLTRWLVEPSSGSLPARRMAARLLERAAREAARRASQGDDGGVWLMESHAVRGVWTHLLGDREPLVWRHVATARGLLSGVLPRFADEIDRDLATKNSPARSRRAAASLAAQVAVRPEEALGRARQWMDSPAVDRDPGLAAAVIYGLPRAAEVEPDAAEELLELAVQKGDTVAAEALLDLRREWVGSELGARAAQLARTQLRARHAAGQADDGHAALVNLLCEGLGESGQATEGLPALVTRAVEAFVEVDARTAYEQARAAVKVADAAVDRLSELLGQDTPQARRTTFRLLHELDAGLLESATLGDLLSLGGAGNDTARVTAPLHALMLRLTHALMSVERTPYQGGEQVPHLTLRMRMLRTLLHLLDDDGRYGDRRDGAGREARLQAVRELFERIQHDAPSVMDRIVHAAVARGCDSLVRDEAFELSDAVLLAAIHVPTPSGFAALAEGSMLPDVKQALKVLSALVRTLHKAGDDGDGRRAIVEALFELIRALPADSAPRTEGLRAALLRLARGLRHVQQARSLRALGDDLRALELIAHAVDDISLLAAGTRRRLGVSGSTSAPTSGHGVWALGVAIERIRSEEARGGLELIVETLADSLRMELPPVLADLSLRILRPVLHKPLETPREAAPPSPAPAAAMDDRPLPAWLPPARILGGFYVLRSLGAGAGGSVFVVTRAEERNDPRCRKLALKVPEYDGSAARSLSEEEFLTLFRQEAGALLAVPQHTNVASFVTFDAGVQPKPILVMELVEGPSLERVLARGEMDIPRALRLIDGVLAGLEAMHSVGVGHLDVKPSNVILREHDGKTPEPVLVDFGLAGRHVRPGCATGNYGAPEIWGLVPEGVSPEPMPADVYATGCVAFEMLTGRTLFEAPNETAMIAAHISHDGTPPAVSALGADPRLAPLSEWLRACLRQDPRQRAGVRELRARLEELRSNLADATWPIVVPDAESSAFA